MQKLRTNSVFAQSRPIQSTFSDADVEQAFDVVL